MAQVTSDTPSAYRSPAGTHYQWHHRGHVVEMPDEEAAELLEIAGPNGGYTIVPAKKAPAKKAVAEPAPPAKLSEVKPAATLTEAGK